MATHGFLACCYEDPNTGSGDQGVMAFDAAFMKYPNLAAKKLGSTGHSQGGQAAFTVMSLAEKKFTAVTAFAGLAMEPASGFGTQPTGGTWQMLYSTIKGPMFMFSGTPTDGLVSQAWVQQAFDALDPAEEAYFWARSGATHIPVPNGEEEQISIPWFRWKLLGDQAACKAFKAIPMMDTTWAEAAVKNAQACM
jgi:dienelactone hydrolase